MIKELIINGVKYADYTIDGDLVGLKMYPPKDHKFIDFNDVKNMGVFEDTLTDIIMIIENTRITKQGYLNI